MDLTEKQMRSKKVFAGDLLHVFADTVQLPNGKEGIREGVRHPGGACVCAIDQDLFVWLVRQYRYAYGTEILEAPAGKIDAGEAPLAAAMRELREETGLLADDLIPMGEMYPSTGYTDEVIHLYLAVGAQQDEQHPDEDEFIHVEKVYLGDAIQMVLSGEIKDAKTQICLLKAYLTLNALSQAEAED